LGEITDVAEFPGERLIVCRNPLVGAQRARKRTELLAATEQDLAAITHRVTAGTLTGADKIGLAVGPALKRYRMRKHFQIEITDTTFTYTRRSEEIAAEAALDGFYILRTSLTPTDLSTGDVVRAYKNLEQAERAFGSIKGPDLQIRPIHHHLADRVRAHVLICMLAYYLTWHLKAAWKPLLFTDEHRAVSPDPVAKAVRSPAAQQKAQTKRTTTGQPAHSYRTLLAELATQTQNTTRLHGQASTFEKLTQPTALQAKALDLAEHAPVVIDR
jgi:Transposase DDE domain